MCFDGYKFRPCEGLGANKLLWGIGVKFINGNAHRHKGDLDVCLRVSGMFLCFDTI